MHLAKIVNVFQLAGPYAPNAHTVEEMKGYTVTGPFAEECYLEWRSYTKSFCTRSMDLVGE